jgi:spore coat protein A, manganese oxidase
MISRRSLFTAGAAAVVGAIAIPADIALSSASASTTNGRSQIDKLPQAMEPNKGTQPLAAQAAGTEFTEAMPIPHVLAAANPTPDIDSYAIDVSSLTVELVPGMSTIDALVFGGTFIGPTIKATVGREVQITYTNNITDPISVHLHGGHTVADSDGYPMDLVQPGQSRTYTYNNLQQACTLWYHDHAMGMEAKHVYYGMHGMYLLHDRQEDDLNLPTGDEDVPIMIRDVQLDTSGNLIWNLEGAESRNTILVNGKSKPYFEVSARKYRFRLVNAANERILNLSLGGASFQQIGSDGGLLPAPVPRTSLTLGSAERADIVIDFSGYALGTQVMLSDTSGQILRFDVVSAETDTSTVPSTLRPLPPLGTPTVTREVTMSMDFSTGTPVGMMNGAAFDPNVVNYQVTLGATEIWEITNTDTAIDHSFHIHLVQFQVLSRTGSPMLPDDVGLKDTIYVPRNTSVRVQATFTDYLGKYVFHCHYLEHSSIGMMGQYEVVSA